MSYFSQFPVGAKFWKAGDRRHLWIVDAVIADRKGRAPFVVMVSENGQSTEDVYLSHREDPEQYLPAE